VGFDTPFDWFKQNASRLGGINQNMVVSWPARIKDKGALRGSRVLLRQECFDSGNGTSMSA
jgi:arylsulfatase A-like enzyme